MHPYFFSACALVGVMCAPLAAGAQDPCDKSLVAAHASPYGYRQRGDRCEGIYVQELAGTALQIASFVESFEDYSLTAPQELLVEWTPAGAEAFRLQARGLRPSLYYRMDATAPAGKSSYGWPTAILASLGIRQRDVGMLGWEMRVIGGVAQRVYHPLRIRQQRDSQRASSYQLVILPGRQLSEVYVRLAALGKDGSLGKFIRDGAPLQYGHYPAERALIIPIPAPKAPGLYYLEIGADLAGGGAATTQLYFYHADR